MKVGINLFTQFALDSVRFISRSLYETLSSEHDIAFLPHEYPYVDEQTRAAMADEFVQACDVVAGTLNPALLAARKRTGSRVPFVPFILGTLPRGGHALRQELPYLTTGDVLLANCRSDVALAARFIPNARVEVVPFAYDDRTFFRLDDAEIAQVRERLGFSRDDRVLLYPGRTTPEKNVHAVLRIFRALLEVVPEAHLVLAGPVSGGGGFMEFGVAPLNYANTITRAIESLGIPANRIHLPGHMSGDAMREWYNAADVAINMTLHHDENFGMAQVEAMACGTPVVGSAWGGLKDTIIHGETGYQISAIPTPTGVKVDWWEALNRVAELMRDAERQERLGAAAMRHVAGQYSPARYRARLESIFSAAAGASETGDPLEASEFAKEYWALCDPRRGTGAPYRRGPRSVAFYRELVTPFAGQTEAHVSADAPFSPGEDLVLATPIDASADPRFRVDSPLYPFELEVPPAYLDAFRAILKVISGAPVMSADHLLMEAVPELPHGADALRWMMDEGLLLRSKARNGIRPEDVPGAVSARLFTVREVDRQTVDLLVY